MRQSTFADFLYAIVIATAISELGSPNFSLEFWARFFLIVAVLEDFFLYQTQVKPFMEGELKLSGLAFEGGILFSWYFSFVSFPDHLGRFLCCFALFYALKWLAGAQYALTRVGGKWNLSRDWRVHRDHAFLILVTMCVVLLVSLVTRNHLNQVEMWAAIWTFWLVQTALYWSLTKANESRV